VVTDLVDQRQFFRNPAQICLWTFGLHLVCEMCARTEWFLSESRRAMASRGATYGIDHLPSGPPLLGTLSAHRPGHDIAKHAIIRPGLADAGSAYRVTRGRSLKSNKAARCLVPSAFPGTSSGLRAHCQSREWFGRVAMQATIVGVVDDVHQEKAATPSRPEIYSCMNQLKPGDCLYLPLIGRLMEVAVRTRASPLELIRELRQVIRRENPELVAEHFSTMDQAVEDSIGQQRLAARVIGIFGGLVLLITIVDLYGL